MSLKTVKNKIKSINKTRQVTRAMEAVSAVKMRKAQSYALSLRPYARAALHMLRGVSGALEAIDHPLLKNNREEKRVGIVVVSPDKGLAGSLVGNIFKTCSRFIAEKGLKPTDTPVFVIGRKANEYFSRRGHPVLASYEKWGDIAEFEGVQPLALRAMDAFLSGEVDVLYLVYTNFYSTLRQEAVVKKLLPITIEGVEESIKAIVPERGRFAELREEDRTEVIAHYAFEPSPGAVLAQLLPTLMQIELYHAVLESNASEHSARMIAMKNASDNAKDLSRRLSLYYNKVRQAAITREVSEIVGGMEAMKQA